MSHTASEPRAPRAAELIRRLEVQLTRFAGADGFKSLLRRSLAMAAAEVPALRCVRVGADGRLEGWEQLVSGGDTGEGVDADEASVAIASHLLGLLMTFIGEPLTLRLIRDGWSDRSPDGWQPGSEADR